MSVRFELNFKKKPESGRRRRAVDTQEQGSGTTPESGRQVLGPPVVLPLEVLELLWKLGDSISTLPGHSISPLCALEDFVC